MHRSLPFLLAALCGIASSVALASTGTAAAATAAPRIAAADALEAPILAELNRVRRAHGLRRLAASRPLTRAADAHAHSMGTRGYFAHTSADGTTFDRRIARFYPMGGRSFWAVGENLLWSSPTVTPAEAVQMWMASPGHRRNILKPRYREIGISAVTVPAAPGTFGGHDVTIVVTDFGFRR